MAMFHAAFEIDANDMTHAHDVAEEIAAAHKVSIANVYRVEDPDDEVEIAMRWLSEEAQIDHDNEGQAIIYTGVYPEKE